MKTKGVFIVAILLSFNIYQLFGCELSFIELNQQTVNQQLTIRKDKRKYTPPAKRKYIVKQLPAIPKNKKSPLNKNKAVPLHSPKEISK